MKIKKQNKIVSLCFDVVFFSFVSLISFCDFFLDSSCESIRLCSFCKKQKQKRFCVKG
jgi:hypothetical protein